MLNAKVTFERPLQSQRTGDLRFDINAGEWASQVAAVDAGAFVELLVPLARGADYTGAVAALRAARELLRQGNIEPAIVEARKAVEQVRDAYGTLKLFNAAKTKAPRQRTYDERWAFMVEDLFSTMSGAGHKDEVTQDFEYTREDAEMLIVATAGMLKRLSLDIATGSERHGDGALKALTCSPGRLHRALSNVRTVVAGSPGAGLFDPDRPAGLTGGTTAQAESAGRDSLGRLEEEIAGPLYPKA
ncbi:hypothetical protein [Micromonospora sp. NPDC093244]|uniref:hypothetical protein n=1 Tax=Micromonospora sp. NPDC093244 TaxID=3155071 RepID=UPI00341B6463